MEHRKTDIEKIRKYLDGELNSSEMYELERRAQDDPLLMDLMLGMESASAHQHEENLADIGGLLEARVKKKDADRSSWGAWFAAASLVLVGMGIGFWLLNKDVMEEEPQLELAQQVPTKPDTASVRSADTSRLMATTAPLQKVDQPKAGVDAKSSPGIQAGRQPQTADVEPKLAAVSKRKISNNVRAERRLAKGVVTDKQTNTPLMGAVVKHAEQQESATTDAKGNFELPVPAESTRLDVSYIGYEQQRVDVTDSDSIKVVMEPSTAALNEVAAVRWAQDRHEPARPAIGWEAYQEYLERSVGHPTGNSAEVTLTFKIDEQGKPIAIRVVEGASEALNQRAIEILSNGSPWVSNQRSPTNELQISIKFH